jgi:acyl-CoA synthetase (AMP-forming)/AMP-acid ligase II
VLLHNILLHSVDKNREQLAASCLENTITYGALDDLTSRLCHCFIDNGVKPGDRVCIYLDKSINSLISIFAILKAGAVYVPLDASAPVNRITTIINDSNPVAILSTGSKIITIVDKLPENCMLVIFDKVSDLKYQNGVIFQY